MKTARSKIVAVAFLVTLAVAYQLFKTAHSTGNYEGLWFSLAHTILVALGVVLALWRVNATQ